jgi:glutamate dehydrogenase
MAEGRIIALSLHAGLWTSAALASRPHEVPVLRDDLSDLTQKSRLFPGAHAGKALCMPLPRYPMICWSPLTPAKVCDLVTAKMALIDRPRPRVVMVRSTLERHVFAFVWLPRDQLSTDVRLQIQAMLLETPGAGLLDWSLEVESGTLALLRFLVDVRACEDMPDDAVIEGRLVEMLRGWNEAVEGRLAATGDEGRAAAIAARYAPAFPPAYRMSYGPAEAALDIGKLRPLAIAADDAGRRTRSCGSAVPAGKRRKRCAAPQDLLHQGQAAFVRCRARAGELRLPRAGRSPDLPCRSLELGSIHDFILSVPAGLDAATLLGRAALDRGALADVLNGAAEDDPFNRLVPGTGLARRGELAAGALPLSAPDGDELHHLHGGRCAGRSACGDAGDGRSVRGAPRSGLRWRPGRSRGRRCRAFTRGLAKVTAINDDRLLRLYMAVIEAVLRTNAFAPAAAEALAFKFDSSAGARPAQARAVARDLRLFAAGRGHSPARRPVARGGLRWSDRRDDFRTEILGLMKAQRVKNAVIVPTGPRAGSIPSSCPIPRWIVKAGRPKAGELRSCSSARCCRSPTTSSNGKVVHPKACGARRADDPYFVVAADKGTATFSDTPMASRSERDFWLDDAFASGGSNGYDHKAMGITARGAWVSVQRHFREMGSTCRATRSPLRAAATCRAMCSATGCCCRRRSGWSPPSITATSSSTPIPIRATSWAERKRLFELPRSSWEDYDRRADFQGRRGVSAQRQGIKLSKQAREALGIDAKEIEPEALISAISSARPSTCCGLAGSAPMSRRLPRITSRSAIRPMMRCASMPRSAGQGDRRRRQPRCDAGRAHRLFAQGRRAHQHRFHRQFGRRRLFGQRGQHQDRAGSGHPERASSASRNATRCLPK